MISLTHLVCPQCQTINRVPTDHLASDPTCGQCKKALFSGEALTVHSESLFDRHIARNDIPVLVDFWAPWCGPCLAMSPAYLDAAQRLEPRVRLLKVDTQAVPALASRFNIRSIPTLALFMEGRERARQAGALGRDDIVRWVGSQLR